MKPYAMGPPEMGNPQEPDSLAAMVQGGSDEIGKLPSRVERLAKAKRRAGENLAHLERVDSLTPVDSYTVRARLRDCGCYLVFRHFYTQGSVKLSSAMFCNIPLLCPFCAIGRAGKALKAYLGRYRTIMQDHPELIFSHVTMTVKNGPDLGERFDHLKAAMKELRKRRTRARLGSNVSEWSKAFAIVGSYEFTNKGRGWHPHVHMCVLHSEAFDYSAMREEWQRLTGDSHVFRVERARHPEDPAIDFLEVFKYALKFSDLTPAQCIEAWLILRARNLLFSVGGFRGVQVPKHLTDDLPDEELPYIDMFYRYLDGLYQIEKTRQGHQLPSSKASNLHKSIKGPVSINEPWEACS